MNELTARRRAPDQERTFSSRGSGLFFGTPSGASRPPVSEERRRLGWAVTLAGAAIMAASGVVMALASF